MRTLSLLLFGFVLTLSGFAQSERGMFSLGGRSTYSLFSDDGTGLGSGGQFRIRLTERVNTDWFADYIVINQDNIARSEYVHIGWSVLFYPMKEVKRVQPYFLAGHCFDYNKKTLLSNSTISKDRWGSAVQAGVGTHFNLTDKFDISLTVQYMVHLTKELDVIDIPTGYAIIEKDGTAIEGHLLSTVSLNYKIGKLWN